MKTVKCISILLVSLLLSVQTVYSQTIVDISDPATWEASKLKNYVNQTVKFNVPFYVCYVGSNYLVVSPRHNFTPTNQAYPKSDEYYAQMTLNTSGQILLYDAGNRRLGEKINHLTIEVLAVGAKVSTSYKGGAWSGSRQDLDEMDIVEEIMTNGVPNVVVCGMNLEYYLVEGIGNNTSGLGPTNSSEHGMQRAKISRALAKINADIYGLVEVQRGTRAMREIANDLTKNTGRQFTYIEDGSSVSGTYTKSCFVYCSDKIEPVGNRNDLGSDYRKVMQGFRIKATGERFILSLNHFKSKVGSGSGSDADQDDGQGAYNYTRVQEAKAVVNGYNTAKYNCNDPDMLIIGDLNAYAKEDPVTYFINNGMTDLHNYFHGNNSYTYTYGSQKGYLDHALCNSALLPQVTGVHAFHINSDEPDKYAYNRYEADSSMFRSSDHDPVIIGLRLDSLGGTALTYMSDEDCSVAYANGAIEVNNNYKYDYYQLIGITGAVYSSGQLGASCTVPCPCSSGIYMLRMKSAYDSKVIKILVP